MFRTLPPGLLIPSFFVHRKKSCFLSLFLPPLSLPPSSSVFPFESCKWLLQHPMHALEEGEPRRKEKEREIHAFLSLFFTELIALLEEIPFYSSVPSETVSFPRPSQKPMGGKGGGRGGALFQSRRANALPPPSHSPRSFHLYEENRSHEIQQNPALPISCYTV